VDDSVTFLKAIIYKNLDEARQTVAQHVGQSTASVIFDDDGEEPQGLLSAVPEDRLSEEDFYRLFGTDSGTLVEVEKVNYSGYGPPADEKDYMGFAVDKCAYVMKGQLLPIAISNCPLGATDIHHLDAMVLDGSHPLKREQLAAELGLDEDWDFDNLFELICAGRQTAEDIDQLIHKGLE
jgi:hypothetical protein